MPKTQTRYVCQQCGRVSATYMGKCPQCGSMFRLTSQHLQAAKGWVQCGMCGNVFHSGIKPPAELGDLHFADPAMAVRAASGTPP